MQPQAERRVNIRRIQKQKQNNLAYSKMKLSKQLA